MSNIVYSSIESICPYIRSARRNKRIAWIGKFRRIYDYQIMFFLKGNGKCLINNNQCNIARGSILFIKPNVKHIIYIDGEVEYMWVHFDFFYRDDVRKLHEYIYHQKSDMFKQNLEHPELIREELIFKEKVFLPDCLDIKDTELIEKLFNKLIIEYQRKELYYQLECKALLLQIIREIICQIATSDYFIIQNHRDKVLLKLYNFIEQNYYKNLTLDDVAKQGGLSGNYISKLMKKETGYTLIEYINHYRIQKARELLMYDDLKVKDISKMVGFNDSHYFSRTFKKYEGISPSDFRSIINKA